MKLQVLSDLHIEFRPFEIPDTDADTVILAGDIGVGVAAVEFAAAEAKRRPVIFVAGNHEYYRGAIPALTTEMRQAAEGTGVHFLEEDELVLDGVRFLGATLWTDWELHGLAAVGASMDVARHGMTDYRLIEMSPNGGRLKPEHTLDFHRRSKAWLQERLESTFAGPTVVVTHHAPSMQSCQERYVRDAMTPAFISHLDPLVTRATLWVHGHTHHCVDYRVAGGRVVSNQRGYPHEAVAGFRPDWIVEV